MEEATSSHSASDTFASDANSRIFHIYNCRFFSEYRISDSEKRPAYYIENSVFHPGTPDVVMRHGSDRKGPVLAVCKYKVAGDMKIGLNIHPHLNDNLDGGAGTNTNTKVSSFLDGPDVIWEDMIKESKFDHVRYRFELDLRVNHTEGDKTASELERRAFIWKRTHSVGVGDSKPSKLSPDNFKLVDEKTGEIVAVVANNGLKSMEKKGKVQISDVGGYSYPGSRFDVMVLVTGLALLEKVRRVKRYRH